MRTIAHISDLHFGRLDPLVTATLVKELRLRAPSLIIVSGDLTQRARTSQFKNAAAFLSGLPSPYLVLPGNHDIPLWNVLRRFFLPLARYRKFISQDLSPVHQDQELFVSGINSARSIAWRWRGFWKDGRLSQRQIELAETQLMNHARIAIKIIVTHHPLISSSEETMGDVAGNAEIALRHFAARGADLCLAGHLHRAYTADARFYYPDLERSILCAQAGTATSTRRRHESNSYNWITTAPNSISILNRVFNGQRFDDGAESQWIRSEKGWSIAGASVPQSGDDVSELKGT